MDIAPPGEDARCVCDAPAPPVLSRSASSMVGIPRESFLRIGRQLSRSSLSHSHRL